MSRGNEYKNRKWKKIRHKVLSLDKGLCQRCIGNYGEIDKKKLTKAVLVHHHYEVRYFPEHVYDIFINEDGVEKRNLYSLCFECHEKVHDRLKVYEQKENEWDDERWD